MSKDVENYRMTPLTVKLVNANDNFAIEDYALAAELLGVREYLATETPTST